jgi:hypothetical protein
VTSGVDLKKRMPAWRLTKDHTKSPTDSPSLTLYDPATNPGTDYPKSEPSVRNGRREQ